jgi:hypothetical protein
MAKVEPICIMTVWEVGLHSVGVQVSLVTHLRAQYPGYEIIKGMGIEDMLKKYCYADFPGAHIFKLS